jgi:hypothetical protein
MHFLSAKLINAFSDYIRKWYIIGPVLKDVVKRNELERREEKRVEYKFYFRVQEKNLRGGC